jgi:Protein of unknown function (DUF3667)
MDLASGIDLETAGPLAVGHPPQKGKKHHKPAEDCQNCGAKLIDEFCHACGQHGHVHRTVTHVIEEVVHGITHFDSRTWRSLPMLAFRPGTLTREYVMGKRARYVPPFAMFLFSIFAMFLAFAFSGGPKFISDPVTDRGAAISDAQENVREFSADVREAQAEVAAAEKSLADLRAAATPDSGEIGGATGELAGARAALENAQRSEATAKRELANANALPVTAPQRKGKAEFTPGGSVTFDSPEERDAALAELKKAREDNAKTGAGIANVAIDIAEKAVQNSEVIAPNATLPTNGKSRIQVDLDAGGVKSQFDSGLAIGKDAAEDTSVDILTMLKDSMREGTFIVTPWPELNKKIAAKTKNPDLFLYKLQNTAYKFSFMLVPLSLPFIWLMLFWKRGVTMYDHAVFALYSLSFVSFVFLMVSLLGHWFPLGPLVGWASLIIPVHLFFQLKGAYQLKWFSAFWRTSLFCGVFSWVILIGFFLTVTALGVSG